MFVDIILLWIVNLFCAKQEVKRSKKANGDEELTAFFLSTRPLEREDRSERVNNDYGQGPNW